MKNTMYSGLRSKKQQLASGTMRRQLLYMSAGVALGFLLPHATVYGGLAPFGVGLAAAISGPGTVLIYLATLAGYLVRGLTDSLRYLAALITVAGIRWSVSGFAFVKRSRLFPSVTAFLGSVITGGALLLSASPSALSVLIILSEGLLAGGFAFFVCSVHRELAIEHEPLSSEGEVSLVAILSVAVMALLTVEFGGISPARIVCMLAILLAAKGGRLAGGSAVGTLVGTAVLLSTPTYAYLAPAYALGGFLAGIFCEKRKWLLSLMLLASVGIVTASSGSEEMAIISLYETVAAGFLFLVMPPSADSAVQRLFHSANHLPQVHSARHAVAVKMRQAARAVQDVAGTVDTVSEQVAGLGAPEPGSIYADVCDAVCRSCKHKMTCWNEHYADTTDTFQHLTPLLRERGAITADDIGGRVKDRCHRRNELAARINSGYREYLVRESAHRRLHELRRVVTDQFSATAGLLDEFATTLSLPEWTDADTATRLKTALSKRGIPLKETVCRINSRGRMEIELLIEGHYHTKNGTAFSQKVGELCGRTFSTPVVESDSVTTRIAFTERHSFRVTVGTAQLRCDGEQLCGDAFECFQDGTGRFLAVLSDGMGSGGRAAVDGAMTVGLASCLLKAGFGNETMLRLINTALMAKSEDESLATLDIAVINLFTGEAEFLKAGAGLSLLYSKGRVFRVDESSLPLGILRELTFATTTDRLVDGDILVLMSDGISNDGVDWVEDLLKDYNVDNGGMQALAQLIADTAREHQSESDDVTVITIAVHRIK